MNALWDFTTEYKNLLELADSIEPEQQQAFDAALDAIKEDLTVEADMTANAIQWLTNQETAIKAEIERLNHRLDVITSNKQRMKDLILLAMQTTGELKITTELHTFRVCKNGGKQKLDIHGEVPDAYQKIVYEIDKDKIRAALEAGEELDFALLQERGQHVRIS